MTLLQTLAAVARHMQGEVAQLHILTELLLQLQHPQALIEAAARQLLHGELTQPTRG